MMVRAEPLQELVRSRIERGELTLGDLAERIGRSYRNVLRVMAAESIGFFLADLYCTALGVHVSDLYPFEYREYEFCQRPAPLEWNGAWFKDRQKVVA